MGLSHEETKHDPSSEPAPNNRGSAKQPTAAQPPQQITQKMASYSNEAEQLKMQESKQHHHSEHKPQRSVSDHHQHHTANTHHQKMSVADYVKSRGGQHAISRILIANNGIAAVKSIRSIRKWAYDTFGNDRAIEFVVMATPEDIKANAAYIHLADEFVPVPGGSNNNNYANVMLIADIAERTGAHAVWPGWGHASENPKLPEALAKTKNRCVWIGPPPDAMRALGDKIGSTIIAQTAGVPCMPWSGDGLEVDYAKQGMPADLYEKACVHSASDARVHAERIGLPIMIKASEGGGGKGIRKVERIEQIESAFHQVQAEVPGSPVFLMKLAPECRHLEAQLLADAHGDAIAIFGRDCSIQRRHQKIIEEGPVVAAPPAVWRDMEKSAIRLAKEVGYCGAGTVEYLYTTSGDYYFLELNPRLQVEHPVTELVSGVNLPAAQLQVAMGIPLSRIRGVRSMFGESPDGLTPINFEETPAKPLDVHVIACRITAENPDSGFQPTSGGIQELNFRSTPDVWGYFSVSARGGVHEFSDSQFGHLFARGETRELARRSMALALKELSIRGDIRTTIEYLSQILESEDYKSNQLSTTWLEKMMARRSIVMEKPASHLAVILGALFRAYRTFAARLEDYKAVLERGQVPSSEQHAQLVRHGGDLIYDNVKYTVQVSKCGSQLYHIGINGWSTLTELHPLSDDGLLVLIDGRKHVVYGQEFASGLRLTVDGKTCLFSQEYDPTQLRAAMQGKLVRYTVKNGQHVEKNQSYAEAEVMKMILTLAAPEAGNITHVKSEGSVLEAGELIATLRLDNPEMVQKAEPFNGTFPTMKGPHAIGENSAVQLSDALTQLQNCSDGYYLPESAMQSAVNSLMSALRNPALPLDQINQILSALIGRIPEHLYESIQSIIDAYRNAIGANRFQWETPTAFPVLQLSNAIDEARRSTTDEDEQHQLDTRVQPLRDMLSRWSDGNQGYCISVLTSILSSYYDIESNFSNDQPLDTVVRNLKKDYGNDIEKVARVAAAHYQLSSRNTLIVMILGIIEHQLTPLLGQFLPVFHQLSSLVNKEYANVSLKARQLIMRQQMPSNEQRRIAISTILQAAASVPADLHADRLAPLIDQSQPIEDLIFSFFGNSTKGVPQKPATQAVAVEAYIRRTYQVFHVRDVAVSVGTHSFRAAHGAAPHPMTQFSGKALIRARWEFYGAATIGSSSSILAQSHVPPQQSPSTAQSNGLAPPPQQQTYLMSKVHSYGNFGVIQRQQSQGLYDGAETDADEPNSAASLTTPSNLQQRQTSISNNSLASPSNVVRTPSSGVNGNGHQPLRVGVMVMFSDFEAVKKEFSSVLEELEGYEPPSPSSNGNGHQLEPPHVIYICLQWSIAASTAAHQHQQEIAAGGTRKGAPPAEELLSSMFRAFLAGQETQLSVRGVRRVTFIITPENEGSVPQYYTYRSRLGFEEDNLIRHIEPSYAHYMQLQRFANYDVEAVPTNNRMVHVFAAYPAKTAGRGLALPPTSKRHATTNTARGAAAAAYAGNRFFVRSLIRKLDSAGLYDRESIEDLDLDAHPETEVSFVDALNALEIAMGGETKKWKHNSVFLNMLVEVSLSPEYIEAVIRLLGRRYDNKLRRLNVSQVELSVSIRTVIQDSNNQAEEHDVSHWRFVCTNPTGYVLNVDTYQEVTDEQTGKTYFKYHEPRRGISAVTRAERGQWDNQEVTTAYPVTSKLQNKRMIADATDTIYVYDFLPLIENGLEKQWRLAARPDLSLGTSAEHRRRRTRANSLMQETSNMSLRILKEEESAEDRNVPDHLMTVKELVLKRKTASANTQGTEGRPLAADSADYELVESDRPAGQNDIGMVAWKLTLHTPQYPQGRDIVVIGNDITFQSGTFGPLEDIVFELASRYARHFKIPRLYLAANSGARIGLAEELRHKFRVAWINDDVMRGPDYLYLSADDYAELKTSVIAAETSVNNEKRYIIKDIVGVKDGLGVENLRGSGTIAGETSLAYNDIYTLTYVTGRTVGIGAYLARLGQRCIQKQSPPIILTGFNALNKLLGKSVYTSNVQLGGIDIMYPNGVTHMTVENDLHGVLKCLQWLSYVPATRYSLPPIVPVNTLQDPIERRVEYKPQKGQAYDPRWLITGTMHGNGDDAGGEWQSGLFDRGSWMEVLGGWAKGVVTGRARLGGIPVGIVAVETRTTEKIIPADPADPNTKETVRQMPGGVWFPDSAFKTATAIWDTTNEGLPVFILANWRGFSGGARDMFDEVLKFGAYIVDALRTCKTPVFVYLPPWATLRGGAWVVVDPTINNRMMEMYADESARGGVLETDGTLEVKFRRQEILAAMHRLDDKLRQLDEELKAAATDKSRDTADLQTAIKEREKQIYPLYHQSASLFADLHDTPGRMKAKGCIEAVVNWEHSRQYFYWRLRRRLLETHSIKRVLRAQQLSVEDEEQYRIAAQTVRSWISSALKGGNGSNADQLASDWFDNHSGEIDGKINQLHTQALVSSMQSVINRADSSGMLASGLALVLKTLSPEQQQQVKKAISDL